MKMAVFAVLAISAVLRLWSLGTPTTFVFDEVYYAKDAKAIIDGRLGQKQGGQAWEPGDLVSWPHPEYGKLAIALGVLAFGDTPFGWRFAPALAGLALLACVYPIARRLGLSRGWALGALVLAATDLLGIAQSRIATLDIFVALWTAVCVLLALKYVQDGHRLRWLALCGLAGGLAVGTKWSGALALLAAGVLLLLFRRRAPRQHVAAQEHTEPVSTARPRLWRALRASLPPILFLVALPAALYVASYAFYFAAGHSFADWREMQRQAFTFNFNLHATHSYASEAPTWILNARPVWYFFESKAEYHGIVAMGNPLLWWSSALALVAVPAAALLGRDRRLAVPALLVALLYFPWFATGRTSFLYYMTPVAPFLAILVATGLQRLCGTPLRWPRRRPSLPCGVTETAFWPTLAFLAAAAATTLFWHPVERGIGWLFWRVPASSSRLLGYVVAAAGGAFICALLGWLISHLRTLAGRQALAWSYVGVIAGLGIVFLPIVVDIGISPERYYRLIWFTSWI